MKSLKTLIYTLLSVALLLSACGSQPPSGQQVKKGGTLNIGTLQEPGILSPLLASTPIEKAIGAFIIEGLVEVDATGQYAPVLAKSLPTISPDGLTVTYQLKPGIKFNDGTPFTCADVQFTLTAIRSDLSGAAPTGYSDIDKIDCPDEHTAVVTFAKVYAPYLELFASILPRSAGDVARLDSWAYNHQPIGTGPWMVTEWLAGNRLTLVKNPNYREAGQPYLDSIIIKFLPSRETGLPLLGAGGLDVLWDLTETDFPALAQLKDQGVASLATATGKNDLLLFNLADPQVDGPADPAANPHPILSELKVRQAIQMGINKQKIVTSLLYDRVKVGTSVLPIGPFACPQEPSRFDVKGAKQLLDEAGWKVGPDGIRIRGDMRLSLKLTSISGNPLYEQTGQALVEMMNTIGVELTLDLIPADLFQTGWNSRGLRKHGGFDLLLYTAGSGIDPGSHLFSDYHSARIPTAENKGAGSNFSRYINPEVDQWIDAAAVSPDRKTRQALYCKVAAQINQDIPRSYLYERVLLSGYRTRLQNYQVSPGAAGFTWDSQNWWIKP